MSHKYIIILIIITFISSNIVNYPNGKDSLSTFEHISYLKSIESSELKNIQTEALDYYTDRTGEVQITYANNKSGKLIILRANDNLSIKINTEVHSVQTVKHISFKNNDYILAYDVLSHSIYIIKNEKLLTKLVIDNEMKEWKENKATFTFIKDFIIFSENKIGTIVYKFIGDEIKYVRTYSLAQFHYINQPMIYKTEDEDYIAYNNNGMIIFCLVTQSGVLINKKNFPDNLDYFTIVDKKLYGVKDSSISVYNKQGKRFDEFFDLGKEDPILGIDRLNDNFILCYNNFKIFLIQLNTKQITMIVIQSDYDENIVALNTLSLGVFDKTVIYFETIAYEDTSFKNKFNIYKIGPENSLFLF